MSGETTQEIYERARFGQSVTLGTRPAVLVVVDFSRGFTEPECTRGSDLTQEVEATNRVLDAARKAKSRSSSPPSASIPTSRMAPSGSRRHPTSKR
jgi:hypothetical protein